LTNTGKKSLQPAVNKAETKIKMEVQNEEPDTDPK
jgi:hypothetical protein